MKYLSWDRPPVEPNLADLIAYFRPGHSYWTDVAGNVIFMNGDGTRNEDIQLPPQEEMDAVLELMNEEWEVEKKRIEVRNKLPQTRILLWKLWKDIGCGIIPGKDGEFYQSILEVIENNPQEDGTFLHPYDEDV